MDYMLLGSKSRKTGFRLNKSCERDKYLMENINEYFNEEKNESPHVSDQTKRPKSKDNNIFDKSNLSILSPLKIGIIISPDKFNDVPRGNIPLLIDDVESQNIVATPLYNKNSFHVKSNLDVKDFQSNYNIPEIIEVEDEEEEENENQILENVPDLLDNSELDYSTAEESVLLDTSQDALLETEIASRVHNKKVKNTDTCSDIDSDGEDSDYIPIKNEDCKLAESNVPLRRSTRIKVPILDYWRNEKIVYKRRSARPELDIFKIITYENENNDSINQKKDTRNKKRNGVTVDNESYDRNQFLSPVENNSQRRKQIKVDYSYLNSKIQKKISSSGNKDIEWVSRGVFEGTIKEKSITEDKLESKKEILAIAPDYIDNERMYYQNNNNYKINILFDSQKDYFASGFMTLPINGQKTLSTIDNIYIIFHVLKGCVEVTISDNNKFVCMKGSTFQIPSYNSYSLVNKGNIAVKLHFVQVTVK